MSANSSEPVGTTMPTDKTIDEAAVLSTLVSSLAPIEQAGRVRLFKTLCTFFDLPFLEKGTVGNVQVAQNAFGTPSQSTASSFSENRTPSPKAFLLEKRPQTEIERVACLAYYLTHYRDEPQFKTLELSKLNTEAAQVKFSNPARAVDNAASALFLIPAGQGKKQLSAIGEVYVQALPDKSAARQAIADLKKRRPKRTNKSGDNEPIQKDVVNEEAGDSDNSDDDTE